MDIMQLPHEWRRQSLDQPRDDTGIRLTLQQCADQLELAYHQDRHDAEFHPHCQFCDWEREHNDNYPEDRLTQPQATGH